MKLLSDFFPIFLFFISYKFWGIYIATGVTIAASVAQTLIFWIRHRRVEPMHLITLILVVILGGATFFFHNELFIKWKPTAINWAFAIAFILSHFIGKKPLIQRMLEDNISLPTPVWAKLNISWSVFFILSGLANLYVIYHFDTNTWVNFKLFGLMGLTVIFALLQGIYLMQHIKHEPEAPKSS